MEGGVGGVGGGEVAGEVGEVCVAGRDVVGDEVEKMRGGDEGDVVGHGE